MIYSRNAEEQLKNLEFVPEGVEEVEIKLEQIRSKFFCVEVNFLSHIIFRKR